MTKTIFKETAIVLLLIIAIGLLLTIIFYDYIPTSKIIPANVVAYKIENEVQAEIDNSITNSTQNIIKTYMIDETDLSVYEATKNYDKGKENPFAISKEYTTSVPETSQGTNTTTSSNTTIPSTNNTTNEEYSGK